jgi:predicted DNA-binding mobile mystery protein A
MARSSELARAVLDERLVALRDVVPLAPPRGWIRAIREALGMTLADLGRRLNVTKQAVLQMETSEADGSIRLATLRRAAEALDCTLVYALVPNGSLDETVDHRARTVATRDVERAHHTMLLEAQAGGTEDRERLVEEFAEQVKDSRDLWRD